MGQNQSHEEEPYHRRHYNETNKQIQRQNSLTLSSPNLLLHRDPSLRRADTLRNSSASCLTLSSKGSDPVPATAKCNITSGPSNDSPTPFIRLLPIEKEPIYFDETEDDDDDDDDDSFDDADDEEDGDDFSDDYNEIELQDQRLAASPYLLERALGANFRQSRGDRYQQHTQDLMDFQVSKDEEEEDLSHLSPLSVPPLQEKTAVEQTGTDSISTKPPSLDAISEEDEALGHSRRGSALEDAEQSRTGRYDTAPLQQANNSSAIPVDHLQGRLNTLEKDSQQSAEELYHLTKADLNKRIQQAVQEVEQKFTDRVQKLEAHTASLRAIAAIPAHGAIQESDPAAMSYPVLATVTHQVGDLDSRVDQMKTLINYKLTDIETKVQELYVGQSKVTQTVDRVNLEQGSDGLKAAAYYGQEENRGGEKPLIDRATIMELRRELQAFGTRYHELNDGLLTDLMSQMRDAKSQLFDTVDKVDEKLGKRVDRIDAELHTQLLNDIESRIQERVKAMEQMSLRLEQSFDKMDGRLGALETVLSSKRMRPESIYRLFYPQHSHPALTVDSTNTQDWRLVTFKSPAPTASSEVFSIRHNSQDRFQANQYPKQF
ncbi:hypothetical protein BGZ72_001676 [Mortierella alpina]|nr:hypothetical protein BGZ72_001676 [Mortierella alpina]